MGYGKFSKLGKLILIIILFYAYFNLVIENYTLRDDLRISQSIINMLIPVKIKPLTKLRKCR